MVWKNTFHAAPEFITKTGLAKYVSCWPRIYCRKWFGKIHLKLAQNLLQKMFWKDTFQADAEFIAKKWFGKEGFFAGHLEAMGGG